jgi:hypothetical protein
MLAKGKPHRYAGANQLFGRPRIIIGKNSRSISILAFSNPHVALSLSHSSQRIRSRTFGSYSISGIAGTDFWSLLSDGIGTRRTVRKPPFRIRLILSDVSSGGLISGSPRASRNARLSRAFHDGIRDIGSAASASAEYPSALQR